MAIYTVATDAGQEAQVGWLRDRENEARARRGQAPVTSAQFVTGFFARALQVYHSEQRQSDNGRLQRAYVAAPATVQEAVRADLAPYVED